MKLQLYAYKWEIVRAGASRDREDIRTFSLDAGSSDQILSIIHTYIRCHIIRQITYFVIAYHHVSHHMSYCVIAYHHVTPCHNETIHRPFVVAVLVHKKLY